METVHRSLNKLSLVYGSTEVPSRSASPATVPEGHAVVDCSPYASPHSAAEAVACMVGVCPILAQEDLSLHKRKTLGKGSFSYVYKANVRSPSGKVKAAAVKVRDLQGSCDRDVADFCLEACLLHATDHPAIVSLYGVGADEANPETGLPSKLYMALEHLGGGSLADMVEKQMLTPQYKLYTDEDALRWSMDVASALAYLHDSKPMLIHRDLKPDNIMLTKDKRTAKLIDFGLHSRVRRPEVMDTLPGGQLSMSCASEASSTDSERSMERAGSFLKSEMLERMSIAPTDAAGRYELTGMTGSMCYMAPEVYSAQLYNQQVDIYSLGVIMYELFSRTLLKVYLRDAEHMQEFAHNICKNGYRPELPKRIPEQLKNLINACWSSSPTKRPSAQQVCDMLTEVQASGVFGNKAAKRWLWRR